MTRREFLLSAAAAALLPRVVQAAVPHSVPTIDTHTHFYDPTRPGGVPWPPKSETLLYSPHLPRHYRETVAELNVVGTVVVEASPLPEDNQWILDLASDEPAIVGFVGNLRPGRSEFAAHLRRFTANPLFRGLRFGLPVLKAVGESAVDADFTRLADAGLAADVIGRLPILEPTLRLAQRWPTLRIVIDHLPFSDWDGNVPALKTALQELAAQPNVFAKVSEIVRRATGNPITAPAFYRPALDALLDLFGPDRVVYGSNWPVSERVAPYATVHRVATDYFATRDAALAEKFFWRNSFAAYRWIPRGAAVDLV